MRSAGSASRSGVRTAAPRGRPRRSRRGRRSDEAVDALRRLPQLSLLLKPVPRTTAERGEAGIVLRDIHNGCFVAI